MSTNLRDPKYFIAVIQVIADGKRAEENFKEGVVSRQVVAKLGQRPLTATNLSALMDEAVALVAQTLEVEDCKVLELPRDADALLLAGIGRQEGLMVKGTVSAGLDSQAVYTLLSSTSVIVEDLRTETWFNGQPLLHNHGVVIGMSTIIHGQGRPFGVLGTHTTRRQKLTEDDVYFLQTIANVLATAIVRKQSIEARLCKVFRRSPSRHLYQDAG